jgi:hypothetical protein
MNDSMNGPRLHERLDRLIDWNGKMQLTLPNCKKHFHDAMYVCAVLAALATK